MIEYSNTLIRRLFTALDLTKEAMTTNDERKLKETERFLDSLTVELSGSLIDYEVLPRGKQMRSVINSLRGIKTVTDFNVRRKVLLDSISTIDRIKKDLENVS